MVRSKGTKSKTAARAPARGSARKSARAGAQSSARKTTTTARGTTATARGTTATARGKTAAAPRRRTTSPGISRIDQEATRTHGYFVRVAYERTPEGTWRPRHRAFFGDASYGGKTKALRAAKEWLAEVVEEE